VLLILKLFVFFKTLTRKFIYDFYFFSHDPKHCVKLLVMCSVFFRLLVLFSIDCVVFICIYKLYVTTQTLVNDVPQ